MVFRKSAEIIQPRKGSLNNPSLRKNSPFFRFNPLSYFNRFIQRKNKVFKCFAISGIGTAAFNRWVFMQRTSKYLSAGNGIVYICSMNFYA